MTSSTSPAATVSLPSTSHSSTTDRSARDIGDNDFNLLRHPDFEIFLEALDDLSRLTDPNNSTCHTLKPIGADVLPNLENLDRTYSASNVASEDREILEELAKMFRIDESHAMNQNVVQSPTNSLVNRACPPEYSQLPSVCGEESGNVQVFGNSGEAGIPVAHSSVLDPFLMADFDWICPNLDLSSQHLNQESTGCNKLPPSPDSTGNAIHTAYKTPSCSPARETPRPVETHPCFPTFSEIALHGPQSAGDPAGEPKSSSHEIEGSPFNSSSLSEHVSRTSDDDCGSDATAGPCQGTGDIAESSNQTLALILEEGEHKTEHDSSVLDDKSEPLVPGSITAVDISEFTAIPSGAGLSSRKRQADPDARNTKSRPEKRQFRGVPSNDEKDFIDWSDVVGSDGFIKESYPLSIERFEMYPDPESSDMITFRWNRHQREWLADRLEDGDLLKGYDLPTVMKTDDMLQHLEFTPDLFDIYCRISWSTTLVMSWTKEVGCFEVHDPVEVEKCMATRNYLYQGFRRLEN